MGEQTVISADGCPGPALARAPAKEAFGDESAENKIGDEHAASTARSASV